MFERYRRPLMAARLMQAEGEVQRSEEGVMHLMAHRIIDRTALLDWLAEQGHEPSNLPHGPYPDLPRAHHPRDVRIIPKSRDFH